MPQSRQAMPLAIVAFCLMASVTNASEEGSDVHTAVMQSLTRLTAGANDPVCGPGEELVPATDHHTRMVADGCTWESLGPIKADDRGKTEEPFGLHRCCNLHDVCYSTCLASHSLCEDDFERCAKSVCEKPLSGEKAACERQALSLLYRSRGFGKVHFVRIQKEACQCVAGAEAAAEARRAYLQDFLSQYDPEVAGHDHVTELLAKWAGREGELYADLIKKHGHHFVTFDDVAPDLHTEL